MPDGTVDYLSRQWLDYTGISVTEPSQSLKEVIHSDDLPKTLASWGAAVERLAPYDVEHRIRAADGSYRWFKTRGTPVTDEAGHTIRWFGTCTDIQDIVDARETLARSREQLEIMVEERTRELAATAMQLRTEIDAREQAQAALLQAQKMEAMGQLTGGVAHDFNNVLTAVSGSLALLEPRISDERGVRLLRTAQRSAARGAKLTEALLAFARKQRLDPVPADLNTIVVEMSEMLGHSIGPSIEIRHVLATELWPVLIDVTQIETALLNIALNARDAMPGGGVLIIQTANIPAGHRELPVEVAGQDCVLVSLRDTGSGMSQEVIERAFEPFFTTKDIGKGTGLGLSMVFGVVRQSGGTVRIRSQLREGTTVLIYLPRSLAASALGSPPVTRSRATEAARILVVDDDPDVRWITAEDLREMGYIVTEADSGRAALAILERDGPCNLMIIDMVMAGLSGVDTARLARRTRPDLKVLFCSGYADLSRFEAAVGNEVVLKKPFPPDILAEAVRAMLGRAWPSDASKIVPLRRSERS
jgi:PAS domain S-box-containing protein